jgi:hypothetical protein
MFVLTVVKMDSDSGIVVHACVDQTHTHTHEHSDPKNILLYFLGRKGGQKCHHNLVTMANRYAEHKENLFRA